MLIRLKSIGKKLRRSPPTLAKDYEIASEQAAYGVIEQVTEFEPGEKIFYPSHMSMVRAEAEATKARIVYDASCRGRKTKPSPKDFLHVGQPLTPLILEMLLNFLEYTLH